MGRAGLEPAESEDTWFTVKTATNYGVTCPFSAVHRNWTCKPFQANCFQDSSLTTRTYGKYLFYFIECDQWESNPYLQIHNLRYWPLYDSHSDPSGARTQHFRLERPVNWPFIRLDQNMMTDARLELSIRRLRVSYPNQLDESAMFTLDGIWTHTW